MSLGQIGKIDKLTGAIGQRTMEVSSPSFPLALEIFVHWVSINLIPEIENNVEVRMKITQIPDTSDRMWYGIEAEVI